MFTFLIYVYRQPNKMGHPRDEREKKEFDVRKMRFGCVTDT